MFQLSHLKREGGPITVSAAKIKMSRLLIAYFRGKKFVSVYLVGHKRKSSNFVNFVCTTHFAFATKIQPRYIINKFILIEDIVTFHIMKLCT
jgi:hypothetical protein